MKYIDTHSHIIFGVDDGAKDLETSINTLKEIKKIGLEHVVCTPHVRYGNTDKITLVNKNYNTLKKYASELGINLYLGNEILYSDRIADLIKYNRINPLNKTKYLLVEFKRSESMNIVEVISLLEELMEKGYKVILAHPELYINYHDIGYMRELKDSGVMLQMDATSILRRNNSKKIYKFAKTLLDEKLIDIVASDSHSTKTRNYIKFRKAYKKIKRKYGDTYAEILFYNNPAMVANIA